MIDRVFKVVLGIDEFTDIVDMLTTIAEGGSRREMEVTAEFVDHQVTMHATPTFGHFVESLGQSFFDALFPRIPT
jgi:hypothetical protein